MMRRSGAGLSIGYEAGESYAPLTTAAAATPPSGSDCRRISRGDQEDGDSLAGVAKGSRAGSSDGPT